MPAHRGSAHHLAKLTEEDVRAARKARHDGIPQKALAARYGVSPGTMGRALRGTTWKHLADTDTPPEASDAA